MKRSTYEVGWSDMINIADKCENINQALHNLIEHYGVDLLQDINKTNAILMDYAPHLDKDIKLIVMVMREGAISRLIKTSGENQEKPGYVINKCVKQLQDSIFMEESAARYAVEVLACALGIHNDDNVKVFSKEMEPSSMDDINYALKEYDAIGYKALASYSTIETLVVPSSIKNIYPKAFLNCINLRSITIPKGIRNIAVCAFEGCCLLDHIAVPEGADYKVTDGMLIDNINKRVIRVENNTSQELVIIPDGVKTICKKAFERSMVKQINLPMSVSDIEENAFFLTMRLEKFEVDSSHKTYRSINGVLHNKSATVLVRYPQARPGVNYYIEDSVEEIGLQAFSCAKNIQAVTFTKSLKSIGKRAFEYCINIENLVLPDCIEIIGDRAFQYCENLRTVMLSRSIIEIGDCAFCCCGSLESVNIPKGIKRIGNFAFANCSKLRKITIQENVLFIGDGVFDGCIDLEISIRNNTAAEKYCRLHEIKYSIL